MGDGEKTPLKPNFDSKVGLKFHGATITSDAALLAAERILHRQSPWSNEFLTS